MKKEFKIYDGDVTVTYEDTPEMRDKVFERIIQYCKEYNCVSGEKLHQNDDCIIYAPDVLSDIIDDIIEFETEYNDDDA